MASERIQRQIDRFLDEAEEAATGLVPSTPNGREQQASVAKVPSIRRS